MKVRHGKNGQAYLPFPAGQVACEARIVQSGHRNRAGKIYGQDLWTGAGGLTRRQIQSEDQIPGNRTLKRRSVWPWESLTCLCRAAPDKEAKSPGRGVFTQSLTAGDPSRLWHWSFPRAGLSMEGRKKRFGSPYERMAAVTCIPRKTKTGSSKGCGIAGLCSEDASDGRMDRRPDQKVLQERKAELHSPAVMRETGAASKGQGSDFRTLAAGVPALYINRPC